MKIAKTGRHRKEFEVLLESHNVQAAMMTIRPGGTSDEGVHNEHPRAEQWIYVIAGSGRLRFTADDGTMHSKLIRAGDAVLIEKKERHQIINTGSGNLRTINFYSPRAYDSDGDEKPGIRH